MKNQDHRLVMADTIARLNNALVADPECRCSTCEGYGQVYGTSGDYCQDPCSTCWGRGWVLPDSVLSTEGQERPAGSRW